jgi:hypothetical protein
VVRFSDILGKISKKHGAKPSTPKPLGEKEFKRPDLGVRIRREKAPPAPVPFSEEPTQEISKGIMERLFQSVLETPAEASPPASPSPPSPGRAQDRTSSGSLPSAPRALRGFRNHAELLKFASILINDVEDALGDMPP